MAIREIPVVDGVKNLPTRKALTQQAARQVLAGPLAKYILGYRKKELEDFITDQDGDRPREHSLRVTFENETEEVSRTCSLMMDWPFGHSSMKEALDAETGDLYFICPMPYIRVSLPQVPDVPVKLLVDSLKFYQEVVDFGKALEDSIQLQSVLLIKTKAELEAEKASDLKAIATKTVAAHSKGLRVGTPKVLTTILVPPSLTPGVYHATVEGRTFDLKVFEDGAATLLRVT